LDLSILVQYFNAEGRFHHLGVGAIVQGWNRCAAAANLSVEILVNVDSRHYAGGDVRAWLDVLGPEDTIVLSANVHELRAYNRLAALARGRQLLLAQDDEAPNPQEPLFKGYDTCWWLKAASRLIDAHEDVAVVGLQELAIHHIRPSPRHDKCPTYAEAERPRCIDRTTGAHTEGVLCAPAGPLLIERGAFVAVRGFDERQAPRGQLGAILVDCELQARLWAAGWATLYLSRYGRVREAGSSGSMAFLTDIRLVRAGEVTRPLAERALAPAGVPAGVRVVAPHLAWTAKGACAQVAAIARRYDADYQQPSGKAFRAVHGAIRHFNSVNLDCSDTARASAYSTPASHDTRAASRAPHAAGQIGPCDCGIAIIEEGRANVGDSSSHPCAVAAAAAAELAAGRGSLRARRAAACADGGCASPWTAASEAPDLSILLQYNNAPGHGHERAIGPLVYGHKRCAAAANLSAEILVNVDSRHYAGGDVRAWLDVLGPEDTIVLSANVHELRAYNRLAALARSRQLLLAQDDDSVPGTCGCAPRPDAPYFQQKCEQSAGYARSDRSAVARAPTDDPARRPPFGAWLAGASALLSSKRYGEAGRIKVVSLNSVLFYVPFPMRLAHGSGRARTTAPAHPVPRSAEEMTTRALGRDSLRNARGDVLQPRCKARVGIPFASAPLELAVEAARCADMAPLLIERAAFMEVGGFDENLAARGRSGSVAVDCEFEARLWLRGYATVAATPHSSTGISAWGAAFQLAGVRRHTAWLEPKMGGAHNARAAAYGRRFQRPGSAETAQITRAARATNALFECPPAHGWVPAAPLDCLIHASQDACAALE
jgi:hypothetical protein